MIKQEDVYRIGRLGKPHGVRGELSFQFEDDIFDRVDADYLILDIDGSKCEKTDGFWGYNFISGTLNNFGDRNTLHGSIDALAENKFMEEREK